MVAPDQVEVVNTNTDDIGIPLFGFFNIEGQSLGNELPKKLVELGALNQVGEPSANLTKIFALEKTQQDFERQLKVPICKVLLNKLIINTLSIDDFEILGDNQPLFVQMIAFELSFFAIEKLDAEFKSKDYVSEAKLAQISQEIKGVFEKIITSNKSALYIFFDQILKADFDIDEVRKQTVDDLIKATFDKLSSLSIETVAYNLSFFPKLQLYEQGIAIDLNFYQFEDSKPEVTYIDRYLQQPIHPSSLVDLAQYYKTHLIRIGEIFKNK